MQSHHCTHAGIAIFLLVIAFLPIPSDSASSASKTQHAAIKVIEATYGANCQAPKGNVTRFVAAECDDKDMCNYRVYYKNMGEEAPANCERNFSVRYTCGRNSRRYDCSVEAESGWGGEAGRANKFCMLYCR